MALIARLCLLSLLLTSAVMCFAMNMPKGNRKSLYEIEDYGETSPNPKHDPRSPLTPGNRNSLYEIEDYGETGPNPKHDPRNPPPTPVYYYPKMQISEDDYGGTGPNPIHDPHPPPPPLMS